MNLPAANQLAIAESASQITTTIAAAKNLVEWGNSHNVQFDVKKTELIHFDSSKKSMKYSVKFMENIILPQELVRYLGVWFD